MRESIQGLLKRPIVRYLASVGAVGLALFVREVLTARLGPDFPEYLMFYPTVMIVALLAGLWPALVAIVVAAGLILLFWTLPGRPPLLNIGTSNFVGLILFVVVCMFLTVVAELYRRSRLKAAAYDKEQAQREAQESARRQAEMLKLSFDAIIVWRAGGVIESWNRGAEELYGWPEAEALGRNVHELLRTPPRTGDTLEEARRAPGEWYGEIPHATRDGRQVVVSSRQLARRGLDGIERVLQVDRDVTEAKRAQEELRRAHDELEEKVASRTADLQRANRTLLMVSACDQALVQISDERELIGVICQIIQDEGGYPLVWVGLREGRNGRVRSVASAGDRDGYLEALRARWGDDAMGSGPVGEAVGSKSPAVTADLAHDGATPGQEEALARGYRSVAAFPLLNPHKEAVGALVIYSEVPDGFETRQLTLLKELADDLAFGIASLRARAERDQAQHAVELKATQLQALAGEIVRTEQRERQRIAQLLHDQIQQLLVATLYGLEGLHDSPATDRAADRETARKLSGLVRECITVSRSLVSELSHPAFTEPDLCTALGWLGSWAREKYGLEAAVDCEQPLTLDVEETRIPLLQAVRELLFNVVKHAGVRRATVRLHRTAGGAIGVSVSDDGVGFDPSRTFEPGKAASGIGLFSMRERLDVIGGGISIDSSVGHGTRVSVWVPAGPAVSPATPAERGGRDASRRPPRRRRRLAGKVRVLLVDDHAVVREGIALQLKAQPDIEVVGEASDGVMAVELVRSLHPDVVTMDVNMPGMNGIEAARLIHAELPATRIIGLSMSEEPAQEAAMKNAGAVGYLSKSASLDRLLAAIRDSSAGGPSVRQPLDRAAPGDDSPESV